MSEERCLACHLRTGSRVRDALFVFIFTRGILLPVVFLSAALCLGGTLAHAQSSTESAEVIRGVVVDSVTRQAISRALVSSPDNRFATLTDSEGRFEFTLSKAQVGDETGAGDGGIAQVQVPNRPYTFTARKPGYWADPNSPPLGLGDDQNRGSQEVTLTLVPESLIIGTVTLPTSEAPDRIGLQIFRRQVRDGRAHWVPAGATQSDSDGQFRFADLQAGTYKLLTRELLDRDPLNVNPLVTDPTGAGARALFGYPPVYYPNAPDFESANPIHLSAGQTQSVNLTLVKKAYYRVRIPVIAPGNQVAESGIGVDVYANGHKGPGFTLGYNDQQHTIEGMLPDGSFTVAAMSFDQNGMTGMQTIGIKGGPIDAPPMVLAPKGVIPVNVKEEFTAPNYTGTSSWSNGRFTVQFRGPRRYLNVALEPVENSGMRQPVGLRDPTGPGDDALAIAGASAGSYWVKVNSQRGYAAMVRSGNIDLEHQALVVGIGGGADAIEITMRDDTAEISGTVEGVPAAKRSGTATGSAISYPRAGAHVYCIPVADGGQFKEVPVDTEGNFEAQDLAPGAYRLLAFEHPQFELEYRNPEAMRQYDSKGPVVRVASGQKERVTLQLISTSEAWSEQ